MFYLAEVGYPAETAARMRESTSVLIIINPDAGRIECHITHIHWQDAATLPGRYRQPYIVPSRLRSFTRLRSAESTCLFVSPVGAGICRGES